MRRTHRCIEAIHWGRAAGCLRAVQIALRTNARSVNVLTCSGVERRADSGGSAWSTARIGAWAHLRFRTQRKWCGDFRALDGGSGMMGRSKEEIGGSYSWKDKALSRSRREDDSRSRSANSSGGTDTGGGGGCGSLNCMMDGGMGRGGKRKSGGAAAGRMCKRIKHCRRSLN
jgi:hypothetical protein